MRAVGLGLVFAVAFAFAGTASADNNIGCGLGTRVFEGKKTLMFQVLGVTLNGTGGQTFAISSNTLGCKSNQIITADARVNMFAGANLDRLALEMASGQGEALESLAALMKIQEPDRAAFYKLTQENFARIFPTDDVTAGQMLENLGTAMVQDPVLARYVPTS